MWRDSETGDLYVGDCRLGDREATDEEITASRPNPILGQITAIEMAITPRRMREAALTDDGKAWLAAKDAEIAALRAKL